MQRKLASLIIAFTLLISSFNGIVINGAVPMIDNIKINGGSFDTAVSKGTLFNLTFKTNITGDIELQGNSFDIGGETVKTVSAGDSVTYTAIRYKGGDGLLTVNNLSGAGIVSSFNILINTVENVVPISSQPRFNLSQTAIPTAKYGEPTSFSIILNNIGNTYASNVTVELSSDVLNSFDIDSMNINKFYNIIQVNNGIQLSWTITANSKILTNKTIVVPVNITYETNSEIKIVTLNAFVKLAASTNNGSESKLTVAGTSGIPQGIVAGKTNYMQVEIKNYGFETMKNGDITISLPEGASLNSSNTTKLFGEITPGKSIFVTYPVEVNKNMQSGNYPLGFEVRSIKQDGTEIISKQTVYVAIKSNGNSNTSTGSIKGTPQLMVERYDYGSKYIMAGQTFNLSLSLLNTSNIKNLKNIKVTLTSDEGTFIPSGSSNSFYIPSINKLFVASKSVELVTKPDAQQKTVGIYVDMTYEDEEGNAYSAKDTISIPVMLETRLRVDELTPPYEAYIGQPVSLSMQFYNMGKNSLNNMFISAEGNFDIQESVNYFAGNVAAGKSDTYSFNVYPRETGTTEGKVVFTYEDAEGKTQVFEKLFSFQVLDMPVIEPEVPIENPKSSLPIWLFPALAGLVIVGALSAWAILRKKKKKQQEQEMDIDEL
ncbi:MAG: NEW3 domain-containing protein [Clostridia bacterium]